MKKGFKLLALISCLSLISTNVCAYAASDESYGLGAEKIINDNFSELKDLMKENDVLFPQDSTGEMNVKYEINCDENGNEYLDVTALYASENTNYQFEPITYNHEIAWTKLGVFIPDWEKVRIINGEEITAESGWYPIVKYYIEHSDSIRKDSAIDLSCGDINADGKIDLTDLSELSLSIIGDKTLTESQIKAADIDENGKADLPDLARLRQYLSKVIDSLRPGKTESKPVDAEELMLGYYNTTNENQFSDVQSSTRIGIKCKPFCSKTETLKVDVAIADLFTDYNADETTTHYIFDVYPTKDGYWREVEDNNFIVNDGTKISREYSKEEWNLFARNSYESDYDSYYHESAEIDFKNYEAGSEGVIRFIFYVKYDENPSNVQTSGDAQYLYYYVGKNCVGLGNSAENAKNEYFSRF